MTPDSMRDWLDSPLVKTAIARAGGDEALDAATLLSAVHELMVELEERLPGIPFDEILSAERKPETRNKVLMYLMREQGFTGEEATELLGPTGLGSGGQQAVLATATEAAVAAMYKDGHGRLAIAEELGLSPRTVDRYLSRTGRVGRPLKQHQIEAARDALAHGVNATARKLGVSPLTIRTWRQRCVALGLA